MKNLRFVLPTAPKQAGPDDAAIAGARGAPLNAEQRQRLACVARKAYDAQVACGLAEAGTFDLWRHATCLEHLGRAGLTAMDQGCYGRGLALFIGLAGGTPSRSNWHAATKPTVRDDADRARGALEQECIESGAAFGGAEQAKAYAVVLLGKIHRTNLASATAKQVWQVLFTLRNRARAKSRLNCPARPLGARGCLDTGEPGKAASRSSAVEMGISGGEGRGAGGKNAAGSVTDAPSAGSASPREMTGMVSRGGAEGAEKEVVA